MIILTVSEVKFILGNLSLGFSLSAHFSSQKGLKRWAKQTNAVLFCFAHSNQTKSSICGKASVSISLSEKEGEGCVLSTAVSQESNDRPGLLFGPRRSGQDNAMRAEGELGVGSGLCCGLRRDG